MKTYVKIYGPPLYDAIKALEKIAIDSPALCIMDHLIPYDFYMGDFSATQDVHTYFGNLGELSIERCSNILSKSVEGMGEYDFIFDWFQKPSQEQITDLIQKIDKALTPLNCKYTLVTK
jgi:hypothetical protein